MKRKTPVVRELNWLMAIPQFIALLGCIGLAFLLLRDSSAIMWGAIAYLTYSYGVRYLVLREHRAGMHATREGQHDRAIRHFQSSYEFFTRHAWVDSWRPIVLMSASGASYREMALVNIAFCQAQVGRTEEARASYTRAATEFPGSPLATAALNLMGRVHE